MALDGARNWFDNRPVVIVTPVSSRAAIQYDQVLLQPPEGGLKNPSVTLPDQIRAVDRARLIGQLGDLKAETLARIDRSLRIVLGL